MKSLSCLQKNIIKENILYWDQPVGCLFTRVGLLSFVVHQFHETNIMRYMNLECIIKDNYNIFNQMFLFCLPSELLECAYSTRIYIQRLVQDWSCRSGLKSKTESTFSLRFLSIFLFSLLVQLYIRRIRARIFVLFTFLI